MHAYFTFDYNFLVLQIVQSEHPEVTQNDVTQLVVTTTSDRDETLLLEVRHRVHVPARRWDTFRLQLD